MIAISNNYCKRFTINIEHVHDKLDTFLMTHSPISVLYCIFEIMIGLRLLLVVDTDVVLPLPPLLPEEELAEQETT